jgi:hypothetical protein
MWIMDKIYFNVVEKINIEKALGKVKAKVTW